MAQTLLLSKIWPWVPSCFSELLQHFTFEMLNMCFSVLQPQFSNCSLVEFHYNFNLFWRRIKWNFRTGMKKMTVSKFKMQTPRTKTHFLLSPWQMEVRSLILAVDREIAWSTRRQIMGAKSYGFLKTAFQDFIENYNMTNVLSLEESIFLKLLEQGITEQQVRLI